MLVTVDRYCELTGRTEYAVRSYINKGVWTEGAEFVRDPKGRIMGSTTEEFCAAVIALAQEANNAAPDR